MSTQPPAIVISKDDRESKAIAALTCLRTIYPYCDKTRPDTIEIVLLYLTLYMMEGLFSKEIALNELNLALFPELRGSDAEYGSGYVSGKFPGTFDFKDPVKKWDENTYISSRQTLINSTGINQDVSSGTNSWRYNFPFIQSRRKGINNLLVSSFDNFPITRFLRLPEEAYTAIKIVVEKVVNEQMTFEDASAFVATTITEPEGYQWVHHIYHHINELPQEIKSDRKKIAAVWRCLISDLKVIHNINLQPPLEADPLQTWVRVHAYMDWENRDVDHGMWKHLEFLAKNLGTQGSLADARGLWEKAKQSKLTHSPVSSPWTAKNVCDYLDIVRGLPEFREAVYWIYLNAPHKIVDKGLDLWTKARGEIQKVSEGELQILKNLVLQVRNQDISLRDAVNAWNAALSFGYDPEFQQTENFPEGHTQDISVIWKMIVSYSNHARSGLGQGLKEFLSEREKEPTLRQQAKSANFSLNVPSDVKSKTMVKENPTESTQDPDQILGELNEGPTSPAELGGIKQGDIHVYTSSDEKAIPVEEAVWRLAKLVVRGLSPNTAKARSISKTLGTDDVPRKSDLEGENLSRAYRHLFDLIRGRPDASKILTHVGINDMSMGVSIKDSSPRKKMLEELGKWTYQKITVEETPSKTKSLNRAEAYSLKRLAMNVASDPAKLWSSIYAFLRVLGGNGVPLDLCIHLDDFENFEVKERMQKAWWDIAYTAAALSETFIPNLMERAEEQLGNQWANRSHSTWCMYDPSPLDEDFSRSWELAKSVARSEISLDTARENLVSKKGTGQPVSPPLEPDQKPDGLYHWLRLIKNCGEDHYWNGTNLLRRMAIRIPTDEMTAAIKKMESIPSNIDRSPPRVQLSEGIVSLLKQLSTNVHANPKLFAEAICIFTDAVRSGEVPPYYDRTYNQPENLDPSVIQTYSHILHSSAIFGHFHLMGNQGMSIAENWFPKKSGKEIDEWGEELKRIRKTHDSKEASLKNVPTPADKIAQPIPQKSPEKIETTTPQSSEPIAKILGFCFPADAVKIEFVDKNGVRSWKPLSEMKPDDVPYVRMDSKKYPTVTPIVKAPDPIPLKNGSGFIVYSMAQWRELRGQVPTVSVAKSEPILYGTEKLMALALAVFYKNLNVNEARNLWNQKKDYSPSSGIDFNAPIEKVFPICLNILQNNTLAPRYLEDVERLVGSKLAEEMFLKWGETRDPAQVTEVRQFFDDDARDYLWHLAGHTASSGRIFENVAMLNGYMLSDGREMFKWTQAPEVPYEDQVQAFRKLLNIYETVTWLTATSSPDMTLEEIGAEMKITKERVRQLKAHAEALLHERFDELVQDEMASDGKLPAVDE